MNGLSPGSAAKGSQVWLQRYVNDRQQEFTDLIISASPGLIAFNPIKVEWKSPLSSDNYREYRDFLSVLGLSQHDSALREFWPLQGPQWDGLAILHATGNTGVLLVEAKAYPEEMESTIGAADPVSVEKIKVAIARTQGYMGVNSANWLKGTYQLANRLAFLYFLNEVARVPAFLALVNFVDDRSHKPTSLAEWLRHYQWVFATMGMNPQCRMLDRIITVFPLAN